MFVSRLPAGVGRCAFAGGAGGNLAERHRIDEVYPRIGRRQFVPLERVLEVEAERGRVGEVAHRFTAVLP